MQTTVYLSVHYEAGATNHKEVSLFNGSVAKMSSFALSLFI